MLKWPTLTCPFNRNLEECSLAAYYNYPDSISESVRCYLIVGSQIPDRQKIWDIGTLILHRQKIWDIPRPKWSAYSEHCRAPWIYTSSESGQLQCALLIHWSSTLKFQGPLNLHCIRIRAAAVHTPNTLIKYTEISGPPVSTLIRLCHFHLSVIFFLLSLV